MKKALVILGLVLASGLAQAKEKERPFRPGKGGNRGNERSDRPGRVEPGQAQYGGNGCPAGTVQAVFAPDNLSFSLLFDRFIADVNSTEGAERGSMSCEVSLPISLPANQQMQIVRVDYRGFVNVPSGGKGALHAMLMFQGRGGGRDKINARYRFEGPRAENYEISTGDMTGQGNDGGDVSPCGGRTVLKIKNQVQVSAPAGQQAQLTVDSIDGSSNAVYYVNWRACR